MRLRHLICLAVAPNVKLTEKYDAERDRERAESCKKTSTFYYE